MMVDRFSDSFRRGKRDAGRAHSDFGYDRNDYNRHGSERQRDYARAWDEGREDKRLEERRRQEEEALQRQEEQWEYERQIEAQRQEEQWEYERQIEAQHQEEQYLESEE